MVTEKMLREATAEAERFLLSSEWECDLPSYTFSKQFEQKMKKLTRRANHPIRYQILRTAAAVLIVIATLFGTVMVSSPTARATVIGWVKTSFVDYFSYSSSDHHSTQEKTYEYHLSDLPEGYQELYVQEKSDGKLYLYAGNAGQIIQFSYAYGNETGKLFIQSEDMAQKSGFVGNVSADIYIASKENETSAIVWQDPETGTLLFIFAAADPNELIVLAESVTKTEK